MLSMVYNLFTFMSDIAENCKLKQDQCLQRAFTTAITVQSVKSVCPCFIIYAILISSVTIYLSHLLGYQRIGHYQYNFKRIAITNFIEMFFNFE